MVARRKQLAFVSKRAHADPDRTSNTDVWVVDAREGAEPRQVTRTPEAESGRAAVEPGRCPDGEQILFLLQDHRRQQVATVPTARVSTRGVEPLTTANRVQRYVNWFNQHLQPAGPATAGR